MDSRSIARPFGLKIARAFEWIAVMREESRVLTIYDKLWLVWKMATVLVRGLFIKDRRWRAKMRACPKCPVFDRSMHRCRPWTGSPLGCGCFTPYLAIWAEECWGDEMLPEDAGWKRFSTYEQRRLGKESDTM